MASVCAKASVGTKNGPDLNAPYFAVYPGKISRLMRLLLICFSFNLTLTSLAAEPFGSVPEAQRLQPFVDVMHAQHAPAFYDQQAAEWQALATSDCGDDDAWFHYYKTARYSNRFGSGRHDLTGIMAGAKMEVDPEGFVYHYLRFVHEENLLLRDAHLLRAHAADPDRHEAYIAMTTYQEVRGDLEQRNSLLARLHAADPIPAGVIDYNFNQLHSVATDGVLITNGDADTYPSWLLQSAYDVRPDVRVVNLALLLGYAGYRETVFRELGVPTDPALTDRVPDFTALIKTLAGQPRPLYLAATTRPYFEQLEKDRLFLTGLAFRYTEKEIDNIGVLAKNYTSVWRLDQLQQPLAEGPVQAVADQLNQNYLPALLELYEYRPAKPGAGFTDVLPLIKTIAARAGRTEEIEMYLRGDYEPQLASISPGLRAKDIYRRKVYIPGGILHQSADGVSKGEGYQKIGISEFFIMDAEVSNADYQLFLEDLLRQRKFKMLDSAAVAPVNMAELSTVFPKGCNLDAYAVHIAGSHPDFANHPVVNVSRRAVKLYAIWLAQVYNQDPKRIDGKKVRFRLPNAGEFEYAARAGKKYAPYPWGGPYYRNDKGCLLANFNTLHPESLTEFEQYLDKIKARENKDKVAKEILRKKEACDYEKDGGDLTVPVDSYFPNDYGLYNMSGNAAEMLEEEGFTMGGSWLDPGRGMQNGVVIKRRLPHPSTGFRLVMEFMD